MDSRSRLLTAGSGVIALAWLCFMSVNYGIAGSASENASRELERMSHAPGPGSGDWWKDDLRSAMREVPRDPTANELLAIGRMVRSNDRDQLAAALDELKIALEARPGSGYTWANLAAVKYRLGETDGVFERALINAIKLAPHEPEVQRDVVNYGLAVMDEVKPETRTAIERAVSVGMKRNAPEILQISARRGKLSAACRHLDGVPRPAESKWLKLCQSLEATS